MQGMTLLMWASRDGTIGSMKELIKRKADLNTQDKDGNAALMMAVENNKVEAVKLLHKARANLFLRNNEGKTAYDLAENQGIKDLLREYMKKI